MLPTRSRVGLTNLLVPDPVRLLLKELQRSALHLELKLAQQSQSGIDLPHAARSIDRLRLLWYLMEEMIRTDREWCTCRLRAEVA